MPFDNPMPYESDRTRNLKAARALIAKEKDWITFNRNDGRGGRCALGAVDAVLSPDLASLHSASWPSAALRATEVSPEVKLLGEHTTLSATQKLMFGHVGPKTVGAYYVAHHNNHNGHAATVKMFDDAVSASIELDALAAFAS